MSSLASPITSLTIVYSVYSRADQRKHQSSASLAFVLGIHRWPVNSPHKGPVTWKMFPFDDVIMLWHRNAIWRVNIGWDNGLLLDGNKPLPEPMLTYNEWCLMAFIWGQFRKRYLSHQSLKSPRKWFIKNFIKTSEGPRSQSFDCLYGTRDQNLNITLSVEVPSVTCDGASHHKLVMFTKLCMIYAKVSEPIHDSEYAFVDQKK